MRRRARHFDSPACGPARPRHVHQLCGIGAISRRAAPLLKGEFHLTATQMGVLLSAFLFWTYAPSQPVVGWIADRYGVRWPNGGRGRTLGARHSLDRVRGHVWRDCWRLRLLLGLGESVVYPCSSKALAHSTATTERCRANAATTVGQSLGPAFGTFVGHGDGAGGMADRVHPLWIGISPLDLAVARGDPPGIAVPTPIRRPRPTRGTG